MSRRRNGKDMDEASKPSGPSSSGSLTTELAFSSDPPFINIFDESTLELYSIMTPACASGSERNGSYNTYATLNRPLIFKESMQPRAYSGGQCLVSNPTLVGEVIYEFLDRTITTPGDISMTDLKAAATSYTALASDLIGAWATTAGLYGLVDAFPRSSGQLKNYLALIGAKPWQQEAKASMLSTLPLPTSLVQYLTQWYAVKQIPDGRNVFCCPSQPNGLTPDEASSSTQAGHDLITFETIFNSIQTLTDTSGKQVWPEMRRILMNAGWKTYDFPTSIPVVRDGTWWDVQVINSPSVGAVSRLSPDVLQMNPQAGQARRTYALSVYGETTSPWSDRLLMPIMACKNQNDVYDRANGTFNTSASGISNKDITAVLLGHMCMKNSYTPTSGGAGIGVPYPQPSYLVIGQDSDTTEIGWAETIAGASASGSLTTLFSEMANVLATDDGSGYTSGPGETKLYEKIFKGESTTVASNRYKFGNTIEPNMTGATAIEGGTVIDGNRAALMRVYTAFLAP